MLGGAWSIVPTVLAGVAVGFGTAILLFALSFQPALDARYDRGAWRETPGPGSGEEQPPQSTLVSLTHDFIDGRPIERVDVAALSAGAPVPPGLARLPEPGEAFVSPALRELIATRPADELGERYGQDRRRDRGAGTERAERARGRPGARHRDAAGVRRSGRHRLRHRGPGPDARLRRPGHRRDHRRRRDRACRRVRGNRHAAGRGPPGTPPGGPAPVGRDAPPGRHAGRARCAAHLGAGCGAGCRVLHAAPAVRRHDPARAAHLVPRRRRPAPASGGRARHRGAARRRGGGHRRAPAADHLAPRRGSPGPREAAAPHAARSACRRAAAPRRRTPRRAHLVRARRCTRSSARSSGSSSGS